MPCQRLSIHVPVKCIVRLTKPLPLPEDWVPPIPTCRTFLSAMRRARRSVKLLFPTKATYSWVPTIRRSNCVLWPTWAKIQWWLKPSKAGSIFIPPPQLKFTKCRWKKLIRICVARLKPLILELSMAYQPLDWPNGWPYPAAKRRNWLMAILKPTRELKLIWTKPFYKQKKKGMWKPFLEESATWAISIRKTVW